MAFNLVHSADWQIGKRFAAFPAELQGVLALARLETIDRLAAVARDGGAGHVVVAGDVFDRESADDALLRQVLTKLATQGDVTWHLLPGNHDPERPGGIWERVRRLSLPGNVRVHGTAVAVEMVRDVWLLPAPLTGRRLAEDPTAVFDTMATPAEAVRIGLAHGSIRGFSTTSEASVAIDPQRALRSGLAYLALGDWHGVMRIDARTWYAGTPEPDRFPQNRPGHALAVTLNGAGAGPAVREVATARHVWREERISLRAIDDLAPVEAEIRAAGAAAGRMLLRLVVDGTLSAAAMAQLDGRLATLRASLAHLDVDAAAVRIQAERADLDALGGDDLRVVGEQLSAMAGREGGDPEQRRIASIALRQLIDLAREAGGAA